MRFRQQGPSRDFSHSIVSLLVFSLTGFVLNLVSLAPISVRTSLYREINEGTDAITIWFVLYGNVFFREIIITLNSVSNPLIFLWRMAEFRSDVSSSLIRPIYATFIRYCGRTALPAQNDLELEEIGASNIRFPTTLQDSLQFNTRNDSRPRDINDDLPKPSYNVLSNPNILEHESSEELGIEKNEISSPIDSMYESIGPVIVHKSAINLSERGLHSNDNIPQHDSESCDYECDCECCYFELNDVKNYSIQELRSQIRDGGVNI